MAEKQTPAPIDRPLQKTYLREFKGWQTNASPGLSEPASFRRMENVFVRRDGSAAVRPGLRAIFTEHYFSTSPLVGSFENFFTNDGKKAVLYAVREYQKVVFKAAVYNSTTKRYDPKTLGQLGFDVSAGLDFSNETTYVRYLQIDNKILALSDQGESIRIFYVGVNKRARVVKGVSRPRWEGEDRLQVVQPNGNWINMSPKMNSPTNFVSKQTEETLISSKNEDNIWNYGYFYTFFNEIGETAPSQIRLIKAQRGYSFWRMVKPDSITDVPTETAVSDADMAADQLAAVIPEKVFNQAVADGATGWNLYGFTWSDQGPVPVDAQLVATRNFGDSPTWDADSWLQQTPMVSGGGEVMLLPSAGSRENYSIPPKASQGLVAGDRLILVHDRENSARIYWTAAMQGEYLNFSASKGGGYKTLTSGNLYLPATAKLWQNPQAVDTITILCMGTDGYSTSYYMAPHSTVSGNTLATMIMGFEETTATPGTVSPYGVEVLNNALYHPLDEEIMKSTTGNYTIHHSAITDNIQNMWEPLRKKKNVISSQLDNRLYYLVDNPEGPPVEAGHMGNEIWVCDTHTAEVWNRWIVGGIALRKVELDGAVYMAVVQKDGIYVFDELQPHDDRRGFTPGTTSKNPIPWYLETNTQGANRTLDAWGRLQQVNLLLTLFSGSIHFGIYGWDLYGKPVHLEKTLRDLNPVEYSDNPLPFDSEDYFLTRKDLKDWYFYAMSATDVQGNVLPSYGRLSQVTYRFVPTTVNVGYEYGSVQTFEYQRSLVNWEDRTTDNGVPIPVLDTRRL